MSTNVRMAKESTPTDPVVRRIALTGGAQLGAASESARGFHCTGAGNIVGQLIGETIDVTETFEAGTIFPYAFKSITSSTATGFLLF